MQPLAKTVLVASLAMTACSSGDTESQPTVSVSSVTDSTTAATTAPPVATTEPAVDVGQSTAVDSTDAPRDSTSTTAPTTQLADSPVPTTGDAITGDDLTRFIAAAEVPLRGTSLEGVVFEAPEIYIAIAQVACARFTDGDTFEEIADDLLAQLESDASDDDQRLVGAIIGAATRTICPEHADKI